MRAGRMAGALPAPAVASAFACSHARSPGAAIGDDRGGSGSSGGHEHDPGHRRRARLDQDAARRGGRPPDAPLRLHADRLLPVGHASGRHCVDPRQRAPATRRRRGRPLRLAHREPHRRNVARTRRQRLRLADLCRARAGARSPAAPSTRRSCSSPSPGRRRGSSDRARSPATSARSSPTPSPGDLGIAGQSAYFVSVAAVDAQGHESLFAYPEYRCDASGCVVPTGALDVTATR